MNTPAEEKPSVEELLKQVAKAHQDQIAALTIAHAAECGKLRAHIAEIEDLLQQPATWQQVLLDSGAVTLMGVQKVEQAEGIDVARDCLSDVAPEASYEEIHAGTYCDKPISPMSIAATHTVHGTSKDADINDMNDAGKQKYLSFSYVPVGRLYINSVGFERRKNSEATTEIVETGELLTVGAGDPVRLIADEDGWYQWIAQDEDNPPVPSCQRVDVRLDNGDILVNRTPDRLDWSNRNHVIKKVVAYRLHRPLLQPAQPVVESGILKQGGQPIGIAGFDAAEKQLTEGDVPVGHFFIRNTGAICKRIGASVISHVDGAGEPIIAESLFPDFPIRKIIGETLRTENEGSDCD